MPSENAANLVTTLRKLKRLPSPPGTALRVLELCRRDDTDVKEIADVLMADPALSGRLLRYANSSTMGSNREVASVRDAVLCLGLRTVKLTALGFSLATGMETDCSGFDLKLFWTGSILTAIMARRFATYYETDREEAFTAGLLAGIGRLGLAYGLGETYAKVLKEAVGRSAPLHEVEQELMGTDHVDFGAELLAHWSLPARLVESVANQLHPGSATARTRPMAQAVHAAVKLAPLFLREPDISDEMKKDARKVIEADFKLDEAGWQTVADEILVDYHQVSNVFEIDLDQAELFDLYAEAQEETTRVGIVAQLEKSEALAENKDLLRQATTDALTGIANRACFDERLKQLVAESARFNRTFALIMFDLDYFKVFNDTYGHATGDLALRRVAETVQMTLRDVDLLARYGGEEFMIIAPNTDQRGACTIAARTRKCVEDLVVHADGEELRVTISVGLALSCDYQNAPSVKQIISDVDRQLFISKNAGRNTWSYRDHSACQFRNPVALS